jgi:hypothetical protein
MKIMKAIQEDVVTDSDSDSDDEEAKEVQIQLIRESLKGNIFKRIQPLTVRNTEYTGLSTKGRFTFLDIYEGIQKF